VFEAPRRTVEFALVEHPRRDPLAPRVAAFPLFTSELTSCEADGRAVRQFGRASFERAARPTAEAVMRVKLT
jgi:hypothetical protein